MCTKGLNNNVSLSFNVDSKVRYAFIVSHVYMVYVKCLKALQGKAMKEHQCRIITFLIQHLLTKPNKTEPYDPTFTVSLYSLTHESEEYASKTTEIDINQVTS